MRTYAISLKGSTKQERQNLYDFLTAKKEPVYADTELTRNSYDYNYFLYDTAYKNWTGSSNDNGLTPITISDFIAKFQEPKINIRNYCIDCTDSIYSERQQITNYLSSISESIYTHTCFEKTDNDILKGVIFGYGSSGEWMTGVIKSSYTLTTKEFIAKFINTRDTMSTINVGDVYLNSSGKTCTILDNKELTNIVYKHEDGKNYTTSISSINKNWTKQTTESITIKPIIANLQPGTKVRVRSDLRYDKDYCMSSGDELDTPTKDMVKRASTIVTIDTLNRFGTYFIKEDKGFYNWTDEMFSEIITTTEEQPIIYKIDKSKLKSGIVIHCDTFEKALAITTAMDDPISNSQFTAYSEMAICICGHGWEYSRFSYYKDNPQDYTIVPFESILLDSTVKPTTCKFKVGDVVRFKPGIKPKDIFNNTTVVLVENMDTATLTVPKLGECYQQDNVQLSNGYWYGQDALELVPQTLEERITKQLEDQVAQQEPIKSIKKEESFMSKLKATAITTIDQNKEAAIIAAKMEAGRVINKQVIKQAAKHVPFWAKGYLDTPLAPVVLANAVAMLGNHTGNAKVQKVSELMLLAAADVTVQSFNLDQIIDDILAGIKLPVGILDDAE